MEDTNAGETKRRLRFREPNPLLVKELRGRMRSARAFLLLTVYLLLLSCLMSVLYYASSEGARMYGTVDTSMIGKALFYGIVLLEVLMVSFITPSLTATAISGERERKTYELLRTTLLSPRRLVLGKLGAALIYAILLILAATPLKGLAFILGGVTASEFILAIGLLILTALAFAMLGLFFSSLTNRTRVSVVLTNSVTLLITFGVPILAALVSSSIYSISYTYSPQYAWLEDFLLVTIYGLASISPAGAAALTAVVLEEEGTFWLWHPTSTLTLPSAWIIFVVFYGILISILLLVTIRRVQRRDKQ